MGHPRRPPGRPPSRGGDIFLDQSSVKIQVMFLSPTDLTYILTLKRSITAL